MTEQIQAHALVLNLGCDRSSSHHWHRDKRPVYNVLVLIRALPHPASEPFTVVVLLTVCIRTAHHVPGSVLLDLRPLVTWESSCIFELVSPALENFGQSNCWILSSSSLVVLSLSSSRDRLIAASLFALSRGLQSKSTTTAVIDVTSITASIATAVFSSSA
jgi:hypothetical protein